MARADLQLRLARSPILRYGLAATFFAIGLCLALLEQRSGLRDLEVLLCLFAIALTVCMRGHVLRSLQLRSRACPNNNRTRAMHSLRPSARRLA